jgi:hypothetical protein
MRLDPGHHPTGPPSGRGVSVKEAARHLDTAVEGVRARVKRGTLRKEKDTDSTVYIILDTDQTRPDGDRTVPDGGQATSDERPAPDQTPEDPALVAALREQVEMLQAEVECWKDVVSTRDRELETRTEELRRCDHLLAAALLLIPAIEAPESPEKGSDKAVLLTAARGVSVLLALWLGGAALLGLGILALYLLIWGSL